MITAGQWLAFRWAVVVAAGLYLVLVCIAAKLFWKNTAARRHIARISAVTTAFIVVPDMLRVALEGGRWQGLAYLMAGAVAIVAMVIACWKLVSALRNEASIVKPESDAECVQALNLN